MEAQDRPQNPPSLKGLCVQTITDKPDTLRISISHAAVEPVDRVTPPATVPIATATLAANLEATPPAPIIYQEPSSPESVSFEAELETPAELTSTLNPAPTPSRLATSLPQSTDSTFAPAISEVQAPISLASDKPTAPASKQQPFQLSRTQKVMQFTSLPAVIVGGMSFLLSALFLNLHPTITGSSIALSVIASVVFLINHLLIKSARNNYNGVGIKNISAVNFSTGQQELLRQQLIAHGIGRGAHIFRNYVDWYWDYKVTPKTDKAITFLLDQLIDPKAKNLEIGHDVHYSNETGQGTVDYFLRPSKRSHEKQHLLTLRAIC